MSAGAPPLETSPPADDTESSPAHRRNGRCARIPHRRWRAPVRRGAAARNAPSVFFTAFLLFFFAPSNIFMMDCTCVAPHAQPHPNKNTSRRIDCTTAAWGTVCKDRQTKNPRMEASDIGTSNTGNAASGPRIDRGLPCAMHANNRATTRVHRPGANKTQNALSNRHQKAHYITTTYILIYFWGCLHRRRRRRLHWCAHEQSRTCHVLPTLHVTGYPLRCPTKRGEWGVCFVGISWVVPVLCAFLRSAR